MSHWGLREPNRLALIRTGAFLGGLRGRKRLKEMLGFTQEDPFRVPVIGLRIALAGPTVILRAGHSFRFWENAIVLENHYATTG